MSQPQYCIYREVLNSYLLAWDEWDNYGHFALQCVTITPAWSISQSGAQWLSGRVLDSRLLGVAGFERHCVVLECVLEQDTSLFSTVSTQEEPSQHN